MKLLSLLATAALFLFGQSTNLCGVSSQTVSVPINEPSSIGQNVYIYNSASESIISPLESTNSLVMVPLQSYNDTMQWTLSLSTDIGVSVYVSSASAGEDAGCGGTNAFWNAPKNAPVTTSCNSAVTQYTDFIFFQTLGPNIYVIAPRANIAACVTIINNTPTIPAAPCNRRDPTSQWQLVTIS